MPSKVEKSGIERAVKMGIESSSLPTKNAAAHLPAA
jgi:hypothetical protein